MAFRRQKLLRNPISVAWPCFRPGGLDADSRAHCPHVISCSPPISAPGDRATQLGQVILGKDRPREMVVFCLFIYPPPPPLFSPFFSFPALHSCPVNFLVWILVLSDTMLNEQFSCSSAVGRQCSGLLPCSFSFAFFSSNYNRG